MCFIELNCQKHVQRTLQRLVTMIDGEKCYNNYKKCKFAVEYVYIC